LFKTLRVGRKKKKCVYALKKELGKRLVSIKKERV